MNYVYLLLLRQMVIVLAVSMPHLSMLLVADVARFGSHPRRTAYRVFSVVVGLVKSIKRRRGSDRRSIKC